MVPMATHRSGRHGEKQQYLDPRHRIISLGLTLFLMGGGYSTKPSGYNYL